jgi:AAA+ ATPase superfamily predicted ATPase
MTAMGFYDAIRFFPHWTDTDRTAAYAVLGGIPHYLRQADPQKSLGENIKQHILSRGSVLYSEVEFRMRQELRETAVYNSIIEAAAMGNTRFNEIHNKTQIEKNKLSVYLKNLVGLELIDREFSLEEGKGSQSNIQRGIYRITDPFFRFWFAFVFPNVSELESGGAEGVYRHVIAPFFDEFVSLAFEEICREYLRRLNRKERLPFYVSRIGKWWDKNSEIDIIAPSGDGKRLILGECKYRRQTLFGLADAQSAFKKYTGKAETSWFFFSRSGFTKDVKELAKKAAAEKKEIRLITLADVIKGGLPATF